MQVTIARTPNGRADSVQELPDGREVFALPLTESRPFPDFLRDVARSKFGDIAYAQSQNNR